MVHGSSCGTHCGPTSVSDLDEETMTSGLEVGEQLPSIGLGSISRVRVAKGKKGETRILLGQISPS